MGRRRRELNRHGDVEAVCQWRSRRSYLPVHSRSAIRVRNQFEHQTSDRQTSSLVIATHRLRTSISVKLPARTKVLVSLLTAK